MNQTGFTMNSISPKLYIFPFFVCKFLNQYIGKKNGCGNNDQCQDEQKKFALLFFSVQFQGKVFKTQKY